MNTTPILEAARQAWERMEPLRERRRRHTRYTYGDQWADTVTLANGRRMTEGEQVALTGRAPLTNNLIRRLVRSVVGRFRSETQADGAKSPVDAAIRSRNRLDELDARTLEEFLISGMAIHYVCSESRPGGDGLWVDNVSPERFFVNDVRDPRGGDMELVGRLLDMSVAEVVMRFAPDDRRRARELRQLYGGLAGASAPGALNREPLSFYHATPGRCRVIEVWTLECRHWLRVHDPLEAVFSLLPASGEPELRRLARRRRRASLPAPEWNGVMRAVWHGRWIAPDGTLLAERDSPFRSGACPFAVKLYPLTDGEVHSLVEDVIDQQRYVNRIITTMDHIMGTAAKGVLLFPVQNKLEGMKWADVGRIWADPGGVLPYKPCGDFKPEQVVTPVSDLGAGDMLRTQIKLFEEVSGVGEALMGKSVSAAVGAARYESEVRNASASIADLMETFRDFLATRNALLVA